MISFAVKELHELCLQNNMTFVVLFLGPVPDEQRRLFEGYSDIVIIDAQPALDEEAIRRAEPYEKIFCHWRGNPPVLVNGHPNALAHQMIAQEFVNQWRRKTRKFW